MSSLHATTPLQIWYKENPKDIASFEKQMRRKVHYVIKPDFLWGNIVHLAKTQNDALLKTLYDAFKYIEDQSFSMAFEGLFLKSTFIQISWEKSRPTKMQSCAPWSVRSRVGCLYSTRPKTLSATLTSISSASSQRVQVRRLENSTRLNKSQASYQPSSP